MKLIGDVHGKFSAYKKIIKEHECTIQVGDMGLGFRKWPHGEWTSNPPYDLMVATGSRFIRGNHDNPSVCKDHTQWIADGTVEGDVMFIGGAYSIDCAYRYPEFTWWEDEEISYPKMLELVDTYGKIKPRVMVTHDCPGEVIRYIPESAKNNLNFSRTSQFLNALWMNHTPELWVFGHHHQSIDTTLNGTRFVCLAELEMKEF